MNKWFYHQSEAPSTVRGLRQQLREIEGVWYVVGREGGTYINVKCNANGIPAVSLPGEFHFRAREISGVTVPYVEAPCGERVVSEEVAGHHSRRCTRCRELAKGHQKLASRQPQPRQPSAPPLAGETPTPWGTDPDQMKKKQSAPPFAGKIPTPGHNGQAHDRPDSPSAYEEMARENARLRAECKELTERYSSLAHKLAELAQRDAQRYDELVAAREAWLNVRAELADIRQRLVQSRRITPQGDTFPLLYATKANV